MAFQFLFMIFFNKNRFVLLALEVGHNPMGARETGFALILLLVIIQKKS